MNTLQFWWHRFIQRVWYGPWTILAYCLSPLTLLYRGLWFCRRLAYEWGFFSVTYLPVPVIVVGNVTVGGTGKSPLVIWLVQYLQKKGIKPGVVVRGYGGSQVDCPTLVRSDQAVSLVGDEALMLSRVLNCPIVACRDRVRAAQYLLEQIECDCLISDDGLQHWALGRALNIVMMDAERGIGNGLCLPAGPLREPWRKDPEALYVWTGATTELFSLQQCPVSLMAVGPQNTRELPLSWLMNRRVKAVAGIGNPGRFFETLRQLGAVVSPYAFPDHYAFQSKDLSALGEEDVIIMTAKDAVKCEGFAFTHCYYLNMQVKPSLAFQKNLEERLVTLGL